MLRKRVVATGLGMITPLGNTVNENWTKVLNGQSAITFLEDQKGKCKVGGKLYDAPQINSSFNSKTHSLAMALASQTLKDAELPQLTEE